MSRTKTLVERIEHDFKQHEVNEERAEKMNEVRNKLKATALFLADNCPEGRELSVALTHLEQAMWAANAAIARNKE